MRKITWLFAGLASIICALLLVQPGNAQIVVSGGGTSNISAGSSNQQVLFNNNGVLGGFGTWDGALLNASAAASGGLVGVSAINTSTTASAAAKLAAITTGNAATGTSRLELLVHDGGANEAEFTIAVDGASGNNTPTTTITAPGALDITAFGVTLTQASSQLLWLKAVNDDPYHIWFSNDADASDGVTTMWQLSTGEFFIDSARVLNSATLHLLTDTLTIVLNVNNDLVGSDLTMTPTLFEWGDTYSSAVYFSIAGPSGTITAKGLTTTGAATGKKVVCVDTATGILYASSTGVDCSN